MERPSRLASSRFSSASVEMPSKPRNDSTATDAAANTTLQVKEEDSKIGENAPAWPLPWASATPPTTRKIASTASSATSMTRVILAVIWMPR